MNVLSLFDGISCGRIALDRVGITPERYFASEIDNNAIKGSKSLYDDIHYVGDVVELNIDELPVIDLLIGGSPCQSFSRSGDGSGFDGSSKLFWEYVRVLREVQEKKPGVKFLLENVVMKKEWEQIITDELGVEPILIDSSLVSAQKRQRLYWTNIEGITQPKDKNITIKDITDQNEDWDINIVEMPSDFLWFDDCEWRVKNATKKGYLTVKNFDCINLDFPNSKTRRGRVAKQKSNTLNTSCNQGIFIDGRIKRLSARECGKLQTFTDNEIDKLKSVMTDNQIKHALGNGWTVDVIAHIFKNIPINVIKPKQR
jgi:DNA-cytosine methyltransferase